MLASHEIKFEEKEENQTVKDFKIFLATKGITLKEFCAALGCNRTHLSQAIKGERVVSARLSRDVKIATDGLIVLQTRVDKKKEAIKEIESKLNKQREEEV